MTNTSVNGDMNDSKLGSTYFLNKKPPLKCVVVGDGGVGKTSMLLRFVHGDFMEEYSPTYYDSFSVTMDTGDEWTQYSMTLVDTAGQETYDRLRTLTYSDTDVFILCFSVGCPDSFTNVKSRWLPELRAFRPKTPIILVGTQTDLRVSRSRTSSSSRSSDVLPSSTSTPSSYISYKKGKRLADKIHAKMYAECSALNGDGLDPIFYKALNLAISPKKKSRFWHSLKRTFVHGE